MKNRMWLSLLAIGVVSMFALSSCSTETTAPAEPWTQNRSCLKEIVQIAAVDVALVSATRAAMTVWSTRSGVV